MSTWDQTRLRSFAPADDTVLGAVDDAYRTKYRPNLVPMLDRGPRSTTVRISPTA
jgi:hypothetical protein